ncbi:MAG: hypothetical protein KDA27_08915 [Candidatus Eisenbacteria bacterium]|uniref:Uncharacterized protein n=1 Tax=Eiseniibacteriota bacterium TaxID=2212470 RepID=A0A956NBI4_UNCEI|nr:hypothetical protein [Candidatus Eisenbacteria bacterium]MCB9463920.1 hypothetical protein [Candidatus Eisenbacteria bacterium]
MNPGASEYGAVRTFGGRAAPSGSRIIAAIARREILLASRRKLVRLLFLFSVLPPIILTVIILVRIFAEQMTNAKLGFDPLLPFLHFQTIPVAVLAFGLGTPLVAQDRAEDVLFLYATRPVSPWHYGLGKMLAVALPCFALLLFPGLVIGILRLGITREVDTAAAIALVAKIGFAGLVVAWGYAGLTVGPSALTKRARWAQLLSFALFLIPGFVVSAVGQLTGTDLPPAGAATAITELLTALLDDGKWGVASTLVLVGYGFLGYWITTARVKREMIP